MFSEMAKSTWANYINFLRAIIMQNECYYWDPSQMQIFFPLHFELILVLIVRHCFSSSTAESTGNLVNSKTEKLQNIEEHINQGHL